MGNSRDITVVQHINKTMMLCLNEKLAIALNKEDNILNKRTEIISKSRRSIKYNLANYNNKD